ncbi:MAG: hypothetical protein JOZ46_05150 [Candidatus Dormibacteraeota bacterium]|nr:hypothetical protein [Candidatus Dormibacteraeota bacterium]MBV9525184.1 hypothetical protein [Candidatus Dormibacteraeota bacterium]
MTSHGNEGFRGRVRPRRRLAAATKLLGVLGVLTLAACGSSSTTGGSSASSPTPDLHNYEGPGIHNEYVDVEPHDNLTDGQTVMVSGLHFMPNLEIAFNMCKLVTRGYSDCDPTTTVMNKAKTDAQGNFPATPYKVTEHVAFPSSLNKPIDCGANMCSVGVGDVGGKTAGSHCVGFGGPCSPEPGNSPLALVPAFPVGALAFVVPVGLIQRWIGRRRERRRQA